MDPENKVLTSGIVSDAFSKVEARGAYGERVVKLWMNRLTYSQVRKYCRDILEESPNVTRDSSEGDGPEGSNIVTVLNQDNLGMIWGVPIRTSETIPDRSLLALSEKDPDFEEGEVPDESRLHRY